MISLGLMLSLRLATRGRGPWSVQNEVSPVPVEVREVHDQSAVQRRLIQAITLDIPMQYEEMVLQDQLQAECRMCSIRKISTVSEPGGEAETPVQR